MKKMLVIVLGVVVIFCGHFAEGAIIRPPLSTTSTPHVTSPSGSTSAPQPIKSPPLHTTTGSPGRLATSPTTTLEYDTETTSVTDSGERTVHVSTSPADGKDRKVSDHSEDNKSRPSSTIILFPIVSVIVICVLLGLLSCLTKQPHKELNRQESVTTTMSTASVTDSHNTETSFVGQFKDSSIQTVSLSTGLVMAVEIKEQAARSKSDPRDSQMSNVNKDTMGKLGGCMSVQDGVLLDVTKMEAGLAKARFT